MLVEGVCRGHAHGHDVPRRRQHRHRPRADFHRLRHPLRVAPRHVPGLVPGLDPGARVDRALAACLAVPGVVVTGVSWDG